MSIITRGNHCAGFALTEVLIAAALLAIGLLGQLTVLTTAIRVEREAAVLATAATLAADAGERLRANRGAALEYAFDPTAPPAPGVDCTIATPYDATTRAACDLDEWRQALATAMPGAAAEIVVTPAGGGVRCTITLRWPAQDADERAYTLQLQV